MRRILVLDDEPAVLNALRRTLRSAFPKDAVVIETFDEPEAAVLRAGEQDFDLVISDYRMPGLNGADVLQLVKGLQPDAIRIVVSATTEFVDIMAAVNRAEIFRYMTKPWDQEELVATVREAFQRRDSLVQARLEQPPGLTQGQRDLQQLEQEEPGITHVNWDEHGNIRLF
jgi:two-component system probable response regulator PhcQ